MRRDKRHAELTLLANHPAGPECDQMLQFSCLEGHLLLRFQLGFQLASLNPWALDAAAEEADPATRGLRLLRELVSGFEVFPNTNLASELAHCFMVHTRVLENYPNHWVLMHQSGASDIELAFLLNTKKTGRDPTLDVSIAHLEQLVIDWYPRFVSQRASDLEALDKALEKYRKVYWRGDAPRVYDRMIVAQPEFYGVSPKVVADINLCTGHGMDPYIVLGLAKVFGKGWRDYVRRFVDNPDVRTLLARPDLCEHLASGDINLVKRAFVGTHPGMHEYRWMALNIHDAGYWLSAPLADAGGKELGKYMMRYDYAKNRPWSRIVAKNWHNLTPEQRKMHPKEIGEVLMAQAKKELDAALSVLPTGLRNEVEKWVLLEEPDVERLAAVIESVWQTYTEAKKVPLPSWASVSAQAGDWSARFFPRCDPKVLFIGHYTNCCQHVCGSAESSAVHSCSSPNAALLGIYRHKKLVGCSWVWEGKDGRVCFDNVEALRGERDQEVFQALLTSLANQLPGKVTAGVGHTHAPFKGHKRYKNGKRFLPEGYDGYSDADTYVVLKV
ncbi:MAG: hypothetical protein JSS66_06300 [Armatimonadetes bacterium]|nr:hypothetical protein [Armatimonadota bacterium]